jgi:hypothetical protein
MMLRTGLYLLFCFLTMSCAPKNNDAEPVRTSKLYVALECVNSPNTNLRVSEFFPRDAKAVPCEDITQGRVYYSEDQLKMTYFENNSSTTEFNCINPKKHLEFLKKHYNQDIVLVYDGKLLHSFRVNIESPNFNCGEQKWHSYEDPTNMCFALAEARDEPIENCTVACSETKSKICLDN